ncbi:hypothetical protein CCMSSC00406_0008936 [Pleurotus cornucopiae]|uniref:Uncharacterized protein n=1 Tax=Pleurotus cornucopiae TaxID=5321 RepID=A0ACB7IYI9_PLECO|nr:hypothetical protein CCMSSC00406_0008936 [Pleurotus cornucopiae]
MSYTFLYPDLIHLPSHTTYQLLCEDPKSPSPLWSYAVTVASTSTSSSEASMPSLWAYYVEGSEIDTVDSPIDIYTPPPVECLYIESRLTKDLDRISALLTDVDWEEDSILIPTPEDSAFGFQFKAFGAYKRVAQKVHPVSGTYPEDAKVSRSMPEDPLDSLPPLPKDPPEFLPTEKLTKERIEAMEINKDNFLLPEEEKLFKHILRLNQDALAFEESDRGTLRKDYFSDYKMATIPHTPWEFRNIPIPPGIRDKVIEMLKSKIDAGVYEPCQSSYRGRWFCVLKKNGSLRIVHDLQPLNAVSIRDAGLLPIIDDFVEPYAGCQCITTHDLYWGFDARIVDPSSRDMTAFWSPLGLLRLTALPMGYTNSPTEFQKCMVHILQPEIPHVANIFVDDLPIKGPKTQYLDKNGKPEMIPENPGIRRFIWEHAIDVHRVMHRVKCAGATFSAKKAQICRKEAVIVGQKCGPEGRSPEDDRVSKILKWPILTTPKEVRGFLGLCGTVRIWIPNYSQLARPLTELVQKGADFIWDERRQEAFDTLKSKVSSAPALRPIDYRSDNPLIMSVDTSLIAVGFILSQNDENGKRRPARYGSLPMNEVQSRYSQSKLELYGLYRALRHWRIYLIGAPKLVVEVDAQYIKGMLKEPDLQPTNAMNRWIQGILMFDFQLVHVPGVNFKGPDGLSRRKHLPEEYIEDDDSWLDEIALHIFLVSTTLPAPTPEGYKVFALPSVKKSSKMTKLLQDIHDYLTSNSLPILPSALHKKRFLQQAKRYFVHQDHMYLRNSAEIPQLVVTSADRRLSILQQAHESLGHKGEHSVLKLLRFRFYWPRLKEDVHYHVSTCHDCQIRNTAQMQMPYEISAPVRIFQKVYLDVMAMRPASGGYEWIVAAKDDLTGVSEAKPMRTNDSHNLSQFLWDNLYCRYGAPEQIVTDNGSEVKGAFSSLAERLGIPQIKITAYNKHANGVVERGHYILREAIVRSCKKSSNGLPLNWHKAVGLAVFADRVTVSSVTGYSPYYLLHGTHPALPFDYAEASFLVIGFRSGMSTAELVALRMRQLERREEDLAAAAETLKRARCTSRDQFMRRFHHRIQRNTFESGELVLVRHSQIQESVSMIKTSPRYLGPYEVVKRTKKGNYVLKELDGTLLRDAIAGFRVIGYLSRDDPEFLLEDSSDSSEELDGADGQPEQEINEEGYDPEELTY